MLPIVHKHSQKVLDKPEFSEYFNMIIEKQFNLNFIENDSKTLEQCIKLV